jgi:hypothetical protein
MSNTSETPKKKLSMAKVKNAKRHLKILQKKHHLSLRALAAKLGNVVTYQTLGRFISEKDYIPSDDKVRTALDLYADPNPYRNMPRWWARTPEALEQFNHTRANVKKLSDDTRREQFAYRKVK